MQHFPIFLDLAGRRVAIAGNGAVALAKLRLLLKTEARLTLFAPQPAPDLARIAVQQGVSILARLPTKADLTGAALAYAAFGAPGPDAQVAAAARAAGVLVNVVDNLEASAFITPAIVDRDPVTVAIGTEGAAPVLARMIKADLEQSLPPGLGALARAAKPFRRRAEALPQGRRRRDFWADYYANIGPQVLAEVGEELLDHALRALLARHLAVGEPVGRVDLVGAGPGDPDLLTLRARHLLDRADVVIHDRLVAAAILDLIRREALFIAVGSGRITPSIAQERINAEMIHHARRGARVVRLMPGDGCARNEAQTRALTGAGIDWAVTPGIATGITPPRTAAPLPTMIERVA